MTDRTDSELKHLLKHWAAQQPLPPSGRARLLRAALMPQRQATHARHFRFSEIPTGLFTWAMVYNMDGRLTTMRLIS
jgi:hypothetical protein